jgi:GH25 family lysozyme M1 (1,4-beta-N-acetylmuramidase)
MATLQQTFVYPGELTGLPFPYVGISFQWPAFRYNRVLRDGKPFLERSQAGTETLRITQDLRHNAYSVTVPNELLVGDSDSSVLNFWTYIFQLGFTNSTPLLPDELRAAYGVKVSDPAGQPFSMTTDGAVYSVAMQADEYQSITDGLRSVNSLAVPDDAGREQLEQRLIDYIRKNMFLLHATVFSETAAHFRALLPELNEHAFLHVVSYLTGFANGRPVLSGSKNQLARMLKTQFNTDKPELVAAIYGLVKDNYAKLTDFPVVTPALVLVDIRGTFRIATSDGSAVALADFGFYDLATVYTLATPDLPLQPTGGHFDWSGLTAGDLTNNAVPFAFSGLVANFLEGPIELRVKAYDGAVLWEKAYAASDPALGQVAITVPLVKPVAITTGDDTPPTRSNKRLHGRVVELSGNCPVKGLIVVIGAKKPNGPEARIVGVATTDASGNFWLPYPYGVFAAAQALVSLTPDSPADVPVRTDAASVAAGETISDDFLYLLLKDVFCPPAQSEDDACDCDKPKDSNRLPGQEELVASDDYTQDIGGSCINLSVPNRTISEYTHKALIRTSDPDVANYTLMKDETTGAFTLTGGQSPIVRKPIDLENPIYWQDASDNKNFLSLYQAVSVATGHVLHYKTQVKADGYSMGELLYSLPLAPGQKKEIVVFDQTHTLTGTETQRVSQGESLSNTLVNDVSIADTLAGNIGETTQGSSSATTGGVSGGLGAAGIISGIAGVVGISGGVANSHSSASQDSARSAAEYFQEQMRNAVTQNAQSYRQLNASVITTVAEGQQYGVTSEVVANHNHCHSLTMMYFEVLKHYAIYQDLSEVEESLFIPLLMTEFTRNNVYKWRDILAANLLPMPSDTYLQPFNVLKAGRQHPLLRAFDAIERIRTNYENVDYPLGAYDDEPISFVTGEIMLRTSLPRPKSKYDRIRSWPLEKETIWSWSGALIGGILGGPLGAIVGGFLNGDGSVKAEAYPVIDEYITVDANFATVPPAQCIRIRKIDDNFFEEGGFDKAQWVAYAALLGKNVFDLLSYYFAGRLISEWDGIFYNDLAPLLFEAIAGRISIGGFSAIDFSSATKYRGGDVPMQINLRGTGSNKKRNEIASLNIAFANSASLTNDLVTLVINNVTIRYSTSHYNGTLLSGYAGDDLIDGTMFPTPENANEKRNPRKEDQYLATKLIEHLNSNVEYYNDLLWRSLDGNRRFMLLDGFNIETFDAFGHSVGYRSLASVVKNELIGIVGNSLVMPAAPGYKVDRSYIVEQPIEGPVAEINLFDRYKPLTPPQPFRVSVPSKGVFAEAVQGRCDACEKVEENTSQDWDKFRPDEPTAINPVTTPVPTVTDWKAAFKDFATPMVNIQNAPAAPAPGAGLAGLSTLLGKSDVFKDITGLDENQKNALQTYLSNQQNAKDFGQMAKDVFAIGHNTDHSDKITDAIRNSPELSKGQKAQLLNDHIAQMIDGGQTKKADLQNAVTKPTLTAAAVKAADQGKAVKATSADESGNVASVDIGAGGESENVLAEVKGFIPNLLQANDNACWATAATIMMSWKKGTLQAVQDVLTIAGSQYVQLFADKKALPSSLKANFIASLGLVGEPPASYGVQKYVDWVNAYGPIWITTDSSAQDGVFSPHAGILVKITGTGTPDGIGTQFTFIDPATGTLSAMAFNDFLKVYEQMVTDNPGSLFIQIVHFDDAIIGEGAGGGGGRTPPAGWPLGLDIYSLNGMTAASIAAQKAAGMSFVITKSSQGTNPDPGFPSRYQWIRDAGMIRGSYHFFSNKNDASIVWGGSVADQANKVIDLVKRLAPGDFAPALDLEDEPRFPNGCPDPPTVHCPAPTGMAPGDGRFPLDEGIQATGSGYSYRHGHSPGIGNLLNDIRDFIIRIERSLGRAPMIYTSRMWSDSDMMHDPTDADLGVYPLWTVAHGRANWNTISFGPWANNFEIMQYGEDVNGLDLDAYSGNLYGLRGLADIGRPGIAMDAVDTCVVHADKDDVLHLIAGSPAAETDMTVPALAQPNTGGDPAAVISAGTLCVYFRQGDQVVQWVRNDPAQSAVISGGRGALHDPRALAVGSNRYVGYWGTDNDWYFLKGTAMSWAPPEAVLTAAGLFPANNGATGQPALYADSDGAIHMVGRVFQEGHLVDAKSDGAGGWTAEEVTDQARIIDPNFPAATYSPFVYSDTSGHFIVFRAAGGDLWTLTLAPQAARFQSTNLTQASSAVACIGHPHAFVLNGVAHVIYRGKDKLVYEIWLDGLTWKTRSVCAVKAAADPVSAANATAASVVFRDVDGVLRRAQFNGTAWTCAPAV